MKSAVIGASGFLARKVAALLDEGSIEHTGISGFRVGSLAGEVDGGVGRWVDNNRREFLELGERLSGVDVVINVAGIGDADSPDVAGLMAANAVLPSVVGRAAREAGVRRFIHVSSAWVQGDRGPLDETMNHRPSSPYSRSRAVGERLLRDGSELLPPEVSIYRPTSVQGVDRRVTRLLARVARLPAVPLSGGGDAPLPVALVDNVAAAIVHLATVERPPALSLHPWEGMTTRKLMQALGADPRFVRFPTPVLGAGARVLQTAARRSPRATAAARWISLLTYGQTQDSRALTESGFTLPRGDEGYRDLGEQLRS